jgi:hypothetical protein
MNDEQQLPRESSNYRPGEPLRSWTSGEPAAPHDAHASIAGAEALNSLRRLLNGDQLSDADLIAFGKLNSHCFLWWYEPMVSLVRGPRISPDVADFLRSSVPGLER